MKSQDPILVVGSTGDLGSTIVRNLLTERKTVKILVRPQSNYQSLMKAGAQPIFGDLKDPESLRTACREANIVITTATATKRPEPDNPITVDLWGNRNLIDAAKECGIQQFIFTSLNLADPNSPIPFVQGKAKAEEHLRGSGMPYTIVAPNAFMETWITLPIGVPIMTGQTVTIVGEGIKKHSFISLSDVAKFIVSSINNPKAINQRVIIGGPEPLSLVDVIAIFEQVLNRKIPVNHIAPGSNVPGLPPLIVEMLAGLNFFESPIEMKSISKDFGVTLTTMKQFIQKSLSVKKEEGD